jgi:hypothetical protein
MQPSPDGIDDFFLTKKAAVWTVLSALLGTATTVAGT